MKQRIKRLFGMGESSDDTEYVVKWQESCHNRWVKHKLEFVGGTTRELWTKEGRFAPNDEYWTEPDEGEGSIVCVDNVITREVVEIVEHEYFVGNSKRLDTADSAISWYVDRRNLSRCSDVTIEKR
jgi:hypothetical protein